ncbi:hypothetical protein FHS70_003666 [Flammeovirga yaeyamensis]|nr:hypothetical protein [Flammeovirga yaeyamensis]
MNALYLGSVKKKLSKRLIAKNNNDIYKSI